MFFCDVHQPLLQVLPKDISGLVMTFLELPKHEKFEQKREVQEGRFVGFNLIMHGASGFFTMEIWEGHKHGPEMKMMCTTNQVTMTAANLNTNFTRMIQGKMFRNKSFFCEHAYWDWDEGRVRFAPCCLENHKHQFRGSEGLRLQMCKLLISQWQHCFCWKSA